MKTLNDMFKEELEKLETIDSNESEIDVEYFLETVKK